MTITRKSTAWLGGYSLLGGAWQVSAGLFHASAVSWHIAWCWLCRVTSPGRIFPWISHSPVGWLVLVHMVTSEVCEPEQSMPGLLRWRLGPGTQSHPLYSVGHGKSQVQRASTNRNRSHLLTGGAARFYYKGWTVAIFMSNLLCTLIRNWTLDNSLLVSLQVK